MDNRRKYYGIFAGIGGFLGVLLGAVAAHKAKDAYAAELLRQASLYALIHSLVLLVICERSGRGICCACFLFALGILLFCGGLSIKALTDSLVIGRIVPVGGSCLMLGWLALAASFLGKKKP